MASITEKLTKLEKKIEKRQGLIKAETDKLNADLAEYDKLYLMALADKFKLKGKDLFSAIERKHEQLEKLRDGDVSDDYTDSTSSVTVDEEEHGDTAVRHSSSPHYFSGEN